MKAIRNPKFAFYFSGNGGRFRKILENKLPDHTALVISDSEKNSDLSKTLRALDIAFYCFDYNELTSEDRNKELSDILLSQFKSYDIDYCFCFGDHILKGQLLIDYNHRIINFHPSILPAYKGRMAIDQALENNEQILGNTAHFLTEALDGGPIIMQNIVHRKRFDEFGYEGILDQQIQMVSKISQLLKLDKIKVVGDKVEILDANYNQGHFYPS